MCIKLFRIIAIFVLLELVFQFTAFVYVNCTKRFINRYSAEGGFRIMFIGDSYTAGADAEAENSYPSKLVKKIKEKHPDLVLQDSNFSYMGANSSQIVLQFLENYKKFKPQVLFLTAGGNNLWSNQDVFIVGKRIGLIDGMGAIKSPCRYAFFQSFLDFMNSLKTVKFLKIINYNLRFKNFEQKKPIPEADTALKKEYMTKINEGKNEETRMYLVLHRDEIRDYGKFYDLILFSFYNDFDAAETYLKNNNLWNQDLIYKDYYRYIKLGSSFEMDHVLDRDLSAIKSLCDRDGIKMIINNYPFKSEWARIVNAKLKSIAEKYGIDYIDNYKYFDERIGEGEWERVMTGAHLNKDGYGYMSDYALDELERIGIFSHN